MIRALLPATFATLAVVLLLVSGVGTTSALELHDHLTARNGARATSTVVTRSSPAFEPASKDPRAAPAPSVSPTATWLNLTTYLNSSREPEAPRGISVADSSMTYDAGDGYYVFYAANMALDYPTHTWILDHGVWAEVRTTVQPPLLDTPILGYDATDGYVVLVGGLPYTYWIRDETWTFSGGVWTNRTADSVTSPSPRVDAGFAYDPPLQEMVLFGGFGSCHQYADGTWDGFNCYDNDTWSYRAEVWTNITTQVGAPPSIRSAVAMAYDPPSASLLLFGGGYATPTGGLTGHVDVDWWTFHGGTWENVTNLSAPHPSLRAYAMSTYDPALRETLLYGGAPMISPPRGTDFLNDTWAYRNGTWINVTTTLVGAAPARGWFLEYFGYNDADNFTLLVDFNAYFGAGGTVYPQAEFSLGPSALLFYHASRPVIDLGQSFTVNATSIPTGANLTFATPPGCASPSAGNLSCTPTTTGPFEVNLSANGSGGAVAVRHIVVQVNPDPGIASFVLVPPAITIGNTTRFVVIPENGTPPFTFGYVGYPTGCGSYNSSSVNCTPGVVGAFRITAHATDAAGLTAYANATLVVNPRPTAHPLLVMPSLIDLGSAVQLQANVSNGTGPLSYGWSGLPPGCVSQDSANFSCIPEAAGNYTISATATDSFGWATEANASLTVLPSVAITVVRLSPALVDVGQTVRLTVAATGGYAPYALRVVGFPGSCDLTAAAAGCPVETAGTFALTVSATDRLGQTDSRPLTLVVYAPLTVNLTSSNGDLSEVGLSTTLTASISGGTPIHSLQWWGAPAGGLPPDCAIVTATSVDCTWIAARGFTFSITVQDQASMSSSSQLWLVVQPALAIAYLRTSTPSPLTGASFAIESNVTGGQGPYSYAYTGLPPGCTDRDGPTVECEVSAAGTYVVTLVANDPLGGNATQSLRFTVQSAVFGVPVVDLVAGVAIAAVAVAAVWVVRQRRARVGREPSRERDAPAAADDDHSVV